MSGLSAKGFRPHPKMMSLHGLGEVSTDGERTIRWTIPRYMQTTRNPGTTVCSPLFSFRGMVQCHITVYLNQPVFGSNQKWLCISCSIPSLPPGSITTISLVDREGREILHKGTDKRLNRYSQTQWLRRTELEAQSEELLPGGRLQIVCRVVLPGERGHRAEHKEESGAEEEETKIVESSNSSGSSSLTRRDHANFIQNFKDLYLNGEDCDFIIKVKDKEFHVHRLVLKARVPAFSAMLTHDMAENKEGMVTIEDCDPDVFGEFLLFVYSDTVDNFSPDNMCGLYVLADKYGLRDLKEMCMDFMKASLSVETVCDVICLAARHRDAGLLEQATDFFVMNAEEILETVKWQLFLAENPTQGNELFLKTLKLGKKKSPKK